MTDLGDAEPTPLAVAARQEEDSEGRLGSGRRLRAAFGSISGISSVHRGITGVLLGSFLILWPGLALNLAVTIVGAALALLGLISAGRALRLRNPALVGRAVLDTLVGLALVVVSSFAVDLMALALAIGLLVRGTLDAVMAVRAHRLEGPVAWYTLRSVGQLVAAAAVIVLGSGVIIIVLLLVGVSWAVGGAIAIAMAMTTRSGAPDSFRHEMASSDDPTHAIVISWFQNQDVGDQARQDIVDKLIFEGPDLGRRIARYASLMAFATAIAALGVQTDSTAVVIGAMLVAPLMTPIMATSLSLVMGRPTRAIRSLLLVAAGVVIAVGLSFLIARYAPGVVEISANSQIASRTAPTLLDLLIALAAGCAGGYAVCRPDVSDSLPGVAIAVALVPPLAVVGITLSAGQFVLAAGAFLLFVTNLVGIIVASGIIFATTGVAPWSELLRNAAQLRRTSITVLVALIVVSIPLALTGQKILTDASNQSQASEVAQAWIDDALGLTGDDALPDQPGDSLRALQLVQVNLDGEVVEVILIGDGELRDTRDLAQRLARRLDRQVLLELRVIPETRISITSE